MGLIRYSCGHILGHHEPIHVRFGVWRFFHHALPKYEEKIHENAEMQKKIFFDDVTLWYSMLSRNNASNNSVGNVRLFKQKRKK